MKDLSIYVHIPFCKSKCFYCAFCSTANNKLQDEYIPCLIKEIKSRKRQENVCSIYLGGGTPSVLKRGYIKEILDTIYSLYNIDKDCEITVEANPDCVDDEFLMECVSVKVNRISLGLQSIRDDVLKNINRTHSFMQFDRAVDTIRKYGITNISGDIILGLPSEDIGDVNNSVSYLIKKGIPHISVYALEIVEGTYFYKRNVKVNQDLQADMYDSIYLLLKENGYTRYEVSNFCINNLYSRHNYGYWIGRDYLGVGLSAHSLIDNHRIENTAVMQDYLSGNIVVNDTPLSLKDRKEEFIMLRLRTQKGIDLALYKELFSCDLLAEKKSQINELIKQNVIQVKDNYLSIKEDYFYIMDSIILKLI